MPPDLLTADRKCADRENTLGYYYVIHGAIPESGPMLSCRRSAGTRMRQYGRKLIKCPHCAARITDTEADTKVELFAQPSTKPVPCQFQLKCPHCKREVGVNIIISL